jgi:predicted RNA-binding Zn-ribbon protein involved in translation (DUF1610 family)
MKAEQFKLTKPARSFWVEGLAIALGLLGLALILAPDRLHNLLFFWINRVKLVLAHSWAAFNHFLDRLTVADLAGFLLLMAFLAIIAWRELARLANSAPLSADACPSCGGDLYRIHRSSSDRLLGSLSGIPLRRYQCSNETCGWQGLRLRREHHHHERE